MKDHQLKRIKTTTRKIPRSLHYGISGGRALGEKNHLLKNKSQVSRNAINQLQFQGINLGNFLAFDDTVEQQVPDFWEKDQ